MAETTADPESQLNIDHAIGPSSVPVRDYMETVIRQFINSIPISAHQLCKLDTGKKCPSSSESKVRAHLDTFVRQRLELIAKYEYCEWVNGRLPFVSPREVRIWRLLQFARFIWAWQIPDDEDLAMIFNLTKRQASNLVSDFGARFRKTIIFPVALRRVYRILIGSPFEENAVTLQQAVGYLYRVPTQRYVADTNSLINELRLRRPNQILRSATVFRQDSQLMWVSDEILHLVRDSRLMKEIFDLYPTQVPGLTSDD